MITATGLPADAETLFRAVAAAADALWVADAAGRIAFLNPAAVKILGYDNVAELLGRPSHETIHYSNGNSRSLAESRICRFTCE